MKLDSDPPPELLARLDGLCLEPAWDAAAYAELRRSGGVGWVALDPAPRGLLVFRTVADEAELLRIGIAPQARRRGLARGLIVALRDHCRQTGIRRIFLEVRAANGAAIGLYEGAGFRTVGRRPGYYATPPDDAVLMALDPRDMG